MGEPWVLLLVDSVRYFLDLAVYLIPLFVAASFLVGLGQAYLPPERIQSWLTQDESVRGVALAAGVGSVLPFDSCASIPLVAGLLQAGAPLGLAVALLLASPLINEVAFVLLLGLYGLQVTLLYLAGTFVLVVAIGVTFGHLGLDAHVTEARFHEARAATEDGAGESDDGRTETSGAGSHRDRFRRAGLEAVQFFREMSPYLVAGMIAATALHEVVPTGPIHALLGPENPVAVPLGVLVGAPMYLSLSAMLPIAASLTDQGVPLGTVLAFVIGGAGASIPNLVLLGKFFDRVLLAAYLLSVVVIGSVVGVAFNFVG